MIEFKYRPDVDGLRAVAVLMVLLFHAGLGFSGGFVGVDVFFVISGFLITGLLLKDQKHEDFRLSHFWIRRVRRILPASLCVVIATLIAGYFILLPSDYEALAKSAIAQQLMLSNVYFWRNTGYFGGDADLKPLLHTWSLGVEEQFYIAYPFLVVLLNRYSRRFMAASLFIALVLSFVVSEWKVQTSTSTAFYLLPTRAWEMLLGGVLCFAPLPRRSTTWFANVLSCLGLAGIVFAGWCFDSTTRFPGVSALLPCIATALVIYGNTLSATWVGRVLSTKPVVYVGLISYSLYLWHWPILSFMRHEYCGAEPSIASRVTSLAVSFVLASFSLRYIESPFRAKSILPDTKRLVGAMAVTIAAVLASSLSVVHLRGLPQRFDRRAILFASAKESRSAIHNVSIEQCRNGDLPTFGFMGLSGNATKCLVWGDSHAMALIPGIDAACKAHQVQGFQATHSSTAPILEFYTVSRYGLNERSPEFSRAVIDFVISQGIDRVILAGVWSNYSKNPQFADRLGATVDELVGHGVKVAIVRDVANQKVDIPLFLSMAVRRGWSVAEIGVSQEDYFVLNEECNRIIDRFQDEGVEILKPERVLVDESGLWRAEWGGQSMYRDSHHLSVEGSLRLSPLFDSVFEQLEVKE